MIDFCVPFKGGEKLSVEQKQCDASWFAAYQTVQSEVGQECFVLKIGNIKKHLSGELQVYHQPQHHQDQVVTQTEPRSDAWTEQLKVSK